MSTTPILPVASNYDFNSTTATTTEQSLFNNVLARFKQAISTGDIATTRTLLHTINVLSPPSAASASSLGTFLTSVDAALANSSASEAQNALATYQSTPSTSAASPEAASKTVSPASANSNFVNTSA